MVYRLVLSAPSQGSSKLRSSVWLFLPLSVLGTLPKALSLPEVLALSAGPSRLPCLWNPALTPLRHLGGPDPRPFPGDKTRGLFFPGK